MSRNSRVGAAQHAPHGLHHARQLLCGGCRQGIHNLRRRAGVGDRRLRRNAQIELGVIYDGALQCGPVLAFYGLLKTLCQAFLHRGLRGQNAGDTAQRCLRKADLRQQAGYFLIDRLVIGRRRRQSPGGQQFQGFTGNVCRGSECHSGVVSQIKSASFAEQRGFCSNWPACSGKETLNASYNRANC